MKTLQPAAQSSAFFVLLFKFEFYNNMKKYEPGTVPDDETNLKRAV